VLIEAHNGSYPYDIALTFWSRMAQQIEFGNIVSARRVYQELAEQEKHQDAVAQFVRNRRKFLCIPASPDATRKLADIEDYLFSKYEFSQAWKFSFGGDPWLVAQA
jgi:hypothetical protein